MIFTADFETNNSPQECRVWSWGMNSVDDVNYYIDGTDISSFIQTIKELCYLENLTVWFHNLKFDGSFILNYLLSRGYSFVKERKLLKPNTFTTLISDAGIWYTISIKFASADKMGIVAINDSLKVLPFSVAQVAKSFDLPETKGSIDYDTIRPIGYEPTPEEKDYQHKDCLIMAKALNRMSCEGMNRITAGSNALHYYKTHTDKSQYEKWFPTVECDEYIRKAYRGGWVYTNPKYKGKNVGNGIVLDVNSLYPSRMRAELFPYGTPHFYTGKYKADKIHPLYVQRLSCSFELKRGRLPTIQIKNSSRFLESEYLSSSNGDIIELTMTNVDLDLFLEHYKVKNLIYHDGYKFKAQCGMFDEYIDYWINRKIECELKGDKAGRTLSKLYLNSLYGKFAKRLSGKSKIPYLDDGVLRFTLGEEEAQDGLYIPVGVFTTAYARNYTIRSAQKLYKRFLYADTDSLHLLGTEEPPELEVDKTKLGAWKHESTFVRAIYLGAKAYVEEEQHTEKEIEKFLEESPEKEGLVNKEKLTILKITCAGLPEKLHAQVSYDGFKIGAVFQGKLMPKQVPGGVILEKTTFEIKKRN